MKKLTFILRMSLFAALLATWSSCSKSSDVVDPNENSEKDSYMTVCEHVVDVANQVVKYHEASSSIAEMSQYIDDIKQIEYVEDVYSTNTTMFVRIKDFGVISYSYIPKKKPIAGLKQVRRMKVPSTRTDSNDEINHSQLGLESAAISVWFKGEEQDCADIISKALGSCGIVSMSKEPDINFFQNDIFDYDVVYVDTHGTWDPVEQLHWLITTEEPTVEEVNNYYNQLDKDKLYKLKNIDRDQLSIGYVDEDRDSKRKSVPYFKVSEKFIKLSTKQFKKPGKSIIFITSCQTVMGCTEITENDQDLRNYSLAKIFEKKGAGVYLGFDESNGVGHYSAMFFFTRLASGMSIERAYESLTDDVLHDERSGNVRLTNGKEVHKTWIADLLPDYSDENKSISSSCIIRPILGEMEDASTETELKFVLKAALPLYLDPMSNYSSEVEKYLKSQYFDISQFSWSFQISENKDFNVLVTPSEQDFANYENNVVTLTQSLNSPDLKSSTTYYYRGFFYDGEEYYYTQTGEFITRTFKADASTIVPDVSGSDF